MEFTSSRNVIMFLAMAYSLILRPLVVIFGALYYITPYFWMQTIEKRVLIFTVLDKITIRNPKMPLQLKPKKCGSKTRRYVFRMDYRDPVYRVSSHSIRKSGLCSGCNGVQQRFESGRRQVTVPTGIVCPCTYAAFLAGSWQ